MEEADDLAAKAPSSSPQTAEDAAAALDCTGSGRVGIRCYPPRRLVDYIRGPCPYAAHGCTARPAARRRRGHRRACTYVPYTCPFKASSRCRFVGPLGALLGHLRRAHFHEDAVQRVWAQELGIAMAKAEQRLAAAAAEEEEAMASGRDIDVIVQALRVSRAVAVKALKKNCGDVVRAVIELIKDD